MDAFHLVIDTSVLRKAHFRHADFERLLRRSQKGTLRIYIPHIVLEEERTRMLADLFAVLDNVEAAYARLRGGGTFGMFTAGLPEPHLVLWKRDEVARHSRAIFDKFLADNKIEKLKISESHANRAWERYFDAAPPFNPAEKREERRKDIPDSWILEAALELKAKRGRHCALVADGKLQDALSKEGFEIYGDVGSLDAEIEKATAVVSAKPRSPDVPASAFDKLRSPAFKDVDVAILGINEVLGAPQKEDLFAQLERAGIDRKIAEHEAQTLVLSGVLRDSGNHFIPLDSALARKAAESETVTALLLKII
jgi:hypothetical protein